MSARQGQRPIDDDSDVEEEALAGQYGEQAAYNDDGDYDLMGAGNAQDLQAQLAAAATPLEYGASIEMKTQSYDSYCNLFHFILNSDGPVDIEVPSVGELMGLMRILVDIMNTSAETDCLAAAILLGMGCD